MPSAARNTTADTSEAVDRFMAGLDHPQAEQVARLRNLILGSAPEVAEGVKWNSPSFRTASYFATINLRYHGGIALILHLGAKARGQEVTIPDPAGLLTWLGPERAAIPLLPSTDIDNIAAALRAVVKAWIAWV